MQVCTCAPVAAVVRVAGGVVASQLAPDTALLWGIMSRRPSWSRLLSAVHAHVTLGRSTLKGLGGERFQWIAT
jgi:hypothetical protein